MDALLTETRREHLAAAGYVLSEPANRTFPAGLDGDPLGERATDRHGRSCRVVVLPVAGHAERLRVWEHLERWRVVDDPGVQPLHDVLDLSDALALVALDDDADTLAQLVTAGRRVSAAPVSTMLVPVEQTLARLHALGLAYGEMAPERILIRSGQPCLAFPLPPSGSGRALTRSVGDDVRELTVLASLLDAPACADQGRLPRPRPGGRPRRHRPERRTMTGVAAALVVLLAGIGYLVLGPGLPPAVPASATAADARGGEVPDTTHPRDSVDVSADGAAIQGDDPVAAAGALTRARLDLVQQLTASSPRAAAEAWEGIVVAGSPAHAQALEAVRTLRATGASITGVNVTVVSAVGLGEDGDTASVEVVYRLSEYALHGSGGSRTVPASGSVTATLDLRRTDDGWRVVAVSESSAASP